MRQVGDRLIPVGVTSSRTQLPEGITTVEDIEEVSLTNISCAQRSDQSLKVNAHGGNASFIDRSRTGKQQ